jgi:glyoxylase-like metal-dependent hydrolase (beta-lactamase superfamily II)
MANLTLGDIQIDRIVEMVQPFETLTEFFPDSIPEKIELCKPWLEPWAMCPETGKFILVVQSYLVRTRHHTILIDTCVGCDKSIPWFTDWNKRTDRSWLKRLAVCGVLPNDIDFVFCTHMHGDHVGWNTQLKNGRWVPTFPNAKYVMSREDFELAEELDEFSYNENVLPVVEAGQAVIVDSNYAMDDHFWLEPTPGHTAGHVSVGMTSKGREAVMSGDIMHSPVQCAFPEWHASSDDDPALAVKTRRQFLEDNCDRNRLVMTAHFPEPSVGRILSADNAFRFVYED